MLWKIKPFFLALLLHGALLLTVIGWTHAIYQGLPQHSMQVVQAFVVPLVTVTPSEPSPLGLTKVVSHPIAHRDAVQQLNMADTKPVAPLQIQAILRYLAAQLQQRLIYPETAAANQQQGRVVVQFTLLPTGKMDDIQVMTSSGYPRLDHAAVATVQAVQPVHLPTPITQALVLQVPIEFQNG